MPTVNSGSHDVLNKKKFFQISRANLGKKTYYEKNYYERPKMLELLRVFNQNRLK